MVMRRRSEAVRTPLGRLKRATAPRRLGLASRGERRVVLIVSGPGGDARRYRGDHRVEQLRAAGVAADTCYGHEVAPVRLGRRYRCIVLYRVAWDRSVERLLDEAGRAGCAVVCDFDDLVFEPARARLLRALEDLGEAERAAYLEGMARQRQTLEACGATTVATAPLAAAAGAIVPRSEVSYNVVSSQMVHHADAAMRKPQRQNARLRIGYLSGTPTHNHDFAEAADALLALFEQYRDLELVVAGFLDLDKRFEAFGDRIVREPYRPAAELPGLLASLDVNLAPLERGNEFVDCKSCIKYLEAGLVGVPTVASPRPDFARAIEHGRNGLIADSSEEWREALAALIDDRELRQTLGEQARVDVLTHHTTRATAPHAAAALRRLVPDLES